MASIASTVRSHLAFGPYKIGPRLALVVFFFYMRIVASRIVVVVLTIQIKVNLILGDCVVLLMNEFLFVQK